MWWRELKLEMVRQSGDGRCFVRIENGFVSSNSREREGWVAEALSC